MKNLKYTKPRIGFVMNEEKSSYEVHLINPTSETYTRVFVLTGAFCGDEDGLIETSKVTREKGSLLPHSSILLEGGDIDGLDFVIWYHLDLYPADSDKPKRVWFELPKYGNGYSAIDLPVIDKEGTLIDLESRMDKETIEEEMKNMNMSGGYTKSTNS